MSHEANPELIRRINAAVWERDASQAGEHEVRFKCPAHDDKHPSAFWNATKGVWNCRACDARGGCLDLARRLGVELPPRETVSIDYTIRDTKGQLVAVHRRVQPPNGKKSFVWIRDSKVGLGGRSISSLPLYGTELLADANDGDMVFIAEGEKAADALRQLGLVALGTVTGASSIPSDKSLAPLLRFRPILWPDADQPGDTHMVRIGAELTRMGQAPLMIDWKGAKESQDAHDFVARGGSASGVLDLVRTAELRDEEAREIPLDDAGGQGQSTRLVRLANEAGVELFHDNTGTAYATLKVHGHRATFPIRQRDFRMWLQHLYYKKVGTAPSGTAVKDALSVIEGHAVLGGVEHTVALRLAEHDGAVYLDLGNSDWSAVRVTADRWDVVSEPPVRFWRPPGFGALPVPEHGGDINSLRRFLSVSEQSWRLYLGFMISVLRPGEHPRWIAAFTGEQGSAKTTHACMAQELIDPCIQRQPRTPPRSERDLAIAAQNSLLLVFDNLSNVQAWLADALCRMSTGAAFACRSLYTDNEEIVINVRRNVVITSIEDTVTAPDLQDRCMMIRLDPLKNRVPEDELWADFYAARPGILGALLDAVACAIRRLPEIESRGLPRMADPAKWVLAAAPALGFDRAEFLGAYEAMRLRSDWDVVDDSPVAQLILSLADHLGSWEGTATELRMRLLHDASEDQRKELPRSANVLSGKLRTVAPSLRNIGMGVDLNQESGSGSRKLIRLRARPRIDARVDDRRKSGEQKAPDSGLCVDGVDRVDPSAPSLGDGHIEVEL